MKHLRPLWAACGVLLLWGCGDGPTSPAASLGIQPAFPPELYPGDEVQLTIQEPGAATWRVRAPEVASVESGLVVALRPGSSWVVVTAEGSRDSVRISVVPRPGGYTAEEVDYFLEIAPGFEYGGAARIIRKWGQDIRLQVHGTPSTSDMEALEGVVAEINALTETYDIVVVETDPLVELHFAPTASFPDILPGYVPGNVGYFSLWWGVSQEFTRAVVLISTDVTEALRRHLIREEVTQALGLGNDSFTHPNSVFYQASSSVSEYAPVDRAVIEMLYRPEVLVGMEPAVAGRVVRRLTRNTAAAHAQSVAQPVAPSMVGVVAPAAQGPAGQGGGSGGGLPRPPSGP